MWGSLGEGKETSIVLMKFTTPHCSFAACQKEGEGLVQWRIQKILVGGIIKILSTKPQKFGCVVTRCVAGNSQWSGCFRGLGSKPPALKNFAIFCKNNLILELVW